MPYNIISNLTLLLSILGIIVLVLRKLPQAVKHQDAADNNSYEPSQALVDKGLPAQNVSKIRAWLKMTMHKIWQFMLEAKGLKQAPKITYNFKRILRKTDQPENKPPIARTEKFYIDLIKRHPKDLTYYDQLGQFYVEARKHSDSANVYEYLTKHEPANSSFFAKLGLARLHLQQFDLAQEAYEKSLALDPSNPSRFYNLALAMQGQKQWKAAALSLRKALELDSTNQKYRDLLFEMESKSKTSVPLDNIHKKK